MLRVQNNLEAEAPLAGYGYFPPLAVHVLVPLAIRRIAWTMRQMRAKKARRRTG
jgi:hypothetical protein